jgi:flavin-dependent dehydrogenase
MGEMCMEYDLLVVGGGLAGSSIAAAMVQAGARVLVVEREPAFRDGVRGEAMLPWGVAEARESGSSARRNGTSALPG